MARVVDSGTARVVVVDRSRTAMAIVRETEALAIARETAVMTVVRDTAAVNVAGIGTQGRPGEKGEPGDGATPTRIADTALSGHRIVRATGAETCGYASVADAAHADDVLGMTIGAAMAGHMATIIDGTSITEPSWAWTPLEPLFLGFDGLLTQTPPTADDSAAQFVLPVGFAQSPTTIMVRIGTAIYY